jgi:hypothetical protein
VKEGGALLMVDLSGVKELKIVVNPEKTNASSHVLLADARLETTKLPRGTTK